MIFLLLVNDFYTRFWQLSENPGRVFPMELSLYRHGDISNTSVERSAVLPIQLLQSTRPPLERIVRRSGADGEPTQLSELLNAGPAAEPAVAAGLGAAEGHLRFIVHGRAIDVAHA